MQIQFSIALEEEKDEPKDEIHKWSVVNTPEADEDIQIPNLHQIPVYTSVVILDVSSSEKGMLAKKS